MQVFILLATFNSNFEVNIKKFAKMNKKNLQTQIQSNIASNVRHLIKQILCNTQAPLSFALASSSSLLRSSSCEQRVFYTRPEFSCMSDSAVGGKV